MCHVPRNAPHNVARLSIDALERHRFVRKAEDIVTPWVLRVKGEEATQLLDLGVMMGPRSVCRRGQPMNVCAWWKCNVVSHTTVDVSAERLTYWNRGVGTVD